MQRLAKFQAATYALTLFAAALLLAPETGRAESILKNVFATVALDGKKIGQIHFTLKSGPTGEIEELRTNASVSMLGIKFYSFVQHLHETWRGGALQTLRSDAIDNGKDEKARVNRLPDAYDAERNGKAVDLPVAVFPDSIWHYKITKQSRLFSSVDLKVMNVSTTRTDENIVHHGKSIAAERFEISGDWDATLWYGKNRRLLKARRMMDGRTITVTIDPDR